MSRDKGRTRQWMRGPCACPWWMCTIPTRTGTRPPAFTRRFFGNALISPVILSAAKNLRAGRREILRGTQNDSSHFPCSIPKNLLVKGIPLSLQHPSLQKNEPHPSFAKVCELLPRRPLPSQHSFTDPPFAFGSPIPLAVFARIGKNRYYTEAVGRKHILS